MHALFARFSFFFFVICLFLPFFFRINFPPHSYIFEDEDSGLGLVEPSTRKKVYVWLLISFFLGFASICIAVWLAIAKLIKHSENYWPGISLMISTILIFISAIIYRFQRAFEEQDDDIAL